ncbi:hypothetical protein HKX48_005468 [Thoreauomyces humboldtii]|nr:hypothetical protein HKX48_005468 [Thoreauomyces humboldtii]
MSSLQHMFGNVDEKGKLEANLPQEFRETLEESADYLSSLLGDFGLETTGDVLGGSDLVQPNADAIDFSGIGNEDLGDEGGEPFTPALPSTAPYVFKIPTAVALNGKKPSDDYDDGYESAEKVGPPPEVYDSARLARLFPGYDDGVMKFSTMFSARFAKRSKPTRRAGRIKASNRMQPYTLAVDERELFARPLPPLPPQISYDTQPPAVPDGASKQSIAPQKEPWEMQLPPSLYPIILDQWEDRVLWEDLPGLTESSRIQDAFISRNYDLDIGSWEDNIRWDAGEIINPVPLPVPTALRPPAPSSPRRKSVQALYKSQFKRFNLSQDRYYEGAAAFGADRVRQTYGPGTLQHAYPAVRLNPQYFKHNLSKRELRSFHRPALRPPLNVPWHFSRVRQLKKRKPKGSDTTNLMRSTRDITLKDSTRFVLLEYSEEYPPIMMNTGMGSLAYNYYRKVGAKDMNVPDLDIGAPFILEEVDATPFLGFGNVEPGQSIQAITNNMYRAPIFRQSAPQTDFLVIRHTLKGESKYYIRNIPYLFTVGQTFPLQEVPRPQSRKITNTVKGRLKVATFRHMRKDPHRRLRYDAIVKQFSHFTETQLRQRLKEFAQFAVKGENTGWWKLKVGIALPGEEEIKRLVTPEMICMQECMQTGQQRLVDIGYTDIGMDEENEEDEATGDIEVQLAPWTTTKNFVLASQNKTMIKLWGPGDPSGRGEAFSFIRASMKEPFLRYGETAEERAERDRQKPKTTHRFNLAEQQQIYQEEIKRIWDAQLTSLSSTERPFGEEDDSTMDMEALSSHQHQMELDEENQRRMDYGYDTGAPNGRAESPMGFKRERGSEREQYSDADGAGDETMSIADSGTSYGVQGRTGRLTIRRLFRNSAGQEEERAEVITDMKIANAYLRQLKIIEAQERLLEGTATNPEADRKRKRRRVREHVEKMKEDRRGKGRDDGDTRRGPPVFLKIRNPSASQLGPNTPGTARTKRMMAQTPSGSAPGGGEDYFGSNPKSYGRRRAAPEVDLASQLGIVIAELIAIPEAYEFCRPVSAVHVPDYYRVITKPKTLEQIRDGVRNIIYKTPAAFIRDLAQVAENCRLYNGGLHPLTRIAEGLVNLARERLRALDVDPDDDEPPPDVPIHQIPPPVQAPTDRTVELKEEPVAPLGPPP